MNTVTQEQIDLINRLKAERQPNTDILVSYHNLRLYYTQGRAEALRAEHLIKMMQDLPFRKRARHIEPGVYETATGLVRVYMGQTSGRTLAKLIMYNGERVWFQYMGLASKHVPADARRLTVEEIGSASLAMNSTHCFVCSRRLDDPESVQRGIGPHCIKNYGLVAA